MAQKFLFGHEKTLFVPSFAKGAESQIPTLMALLHLFFGPQDLGYDNH